MGPMESIEGVARKAGWFPLRPAQEKALECLFQGRNLVLIWPTGSGKSLCYQLPALVLDGLTIVVSPLIALMEDQVAKGRAMGWPTTCIHSGVPREGREKRLKDVLSGQVKLLYVTPERFRQPEFHEAVGGLKVSLMAVDEAHCISQWGHDFRPDYSRIGEIRKFLGNPQVIALTATATVEVQADILRQLDLNAENSTVIWEGVERPNLYLAGEEFDDHEAKLSRLVGWLGEVSGDKIVYFTLITTLAKVSAHLSAKGIPHVTYHGDLDDSARRRNQRAFLAGDIAVMLATPAFGLGIDKPDVRGVLHFELPGSLEAYFQEVGRAGRDGRNSNCLLLYEQTDLATQMRFVETLTPDPSYIRAVYQLLLSWRDRLPTASLDDLREQLSFKNKKDFRLETSLNILDRWEVLRWPQRKLSRLEILRPLTEDDLSEEVWKERKLLLQKKLLSLVQWFRSEECRKVGIYKYFGWPDQTACGFCDRCRPGA